MKKLLGIVVLGLLLSGNVLADILSTAEQKKLISNGTIKKGMTKEFLELTISPSVWSAGTVSIFNLKKSGINVWCSYSGVGYCFDGKANKKNSKLIQIWEDPNEMADYWLKKATHKKNIKQINIFKGDIIKYSLVERYAKKSNTATASSSSSTVTTGSSLSTDDKISKSKTICKELGFKANSEKFSDCALKMMALQFETGGKVSNNDGSSTQKIIVQQQDDFDIGDFFFGLQKIVDDNYRSTNNSSNQGTKCTIKPMAWGADMVCR